MPETPYIGTRYRPRMLGPPTSGSSMMQPRMGRRPTMTTQPIMLLPPMGPPQSGGTIYGGGDNGSGGGNGGQPGGGWGGGGGDSGWGGTGNEDGSPTPAEQYGWPQLSDNFPNLNFHGAGEGGMLTRLGNLFSGASSMTPTGMLATMLGKPLAGFAPFKSSPQMTSSASLSGGYASEPMPMGTGPGQDTWGGATAPNGRQSADPRVQVSMLDAPPDGAGDWRTDQQGSFDPSMLATYYDQQNPDGKDWYWDPVTETYYA